MGKYFNFRDLHLQLDEVVSRPASSPTPWPAMRAVYVTPDGRAATVAAQTSPAPFPPDEVDTAETVDLITAAIYPTAGTARRIHDDVDREDPTTSDTLHAFLERLERWPG